jgi:hypothetical protein
MHGEDAVSLLCVEGPDIGHCKRGLLTVAGAAHNAGFVSTGGGAVTLGGGGENIVLTRPPGSVRFAWPRRPVVRPIFADGTRGNPIPAPTAGTNWWTIDLANAGETMWWEIEG